MGKKYREWKELFQMKKKYSKNQPYCFYELAGEYLPEDKNAIIIDVGCGSCNFEDHLKLWDKYRKIILLDRNKDTIGRLKEKCKPFDLIHTYEYIAPEQISFVMDRSVSYIYCAHLIEHLNSADVFNLFYEFNRVLKPNGILVISSPMLWVNFYNDLDHVKPYQPAFYEYYFCGKESGNLSFIPISKDYKIEKLVYRYHTFLSDSNRIGSSNKIIDFIIQGIGRISRRFGIRRYMRSGYIIILRKGK